MLPRLLCLLVILLSLPLRAAEPDEAPPAEEETTVADADSTAEQDAAIAEEIRAAEEAAANAPAADPNEPFIPSVQISEDLSVSFPVDI
jgi:hypothetical protein